METAAATSVDPPTPGAQYYCHPDEMVVAVVFVENNHIGIAPKAATRFDPTTYGTGVISLSEWREYVECGVYRHEGTTNQTTDVIGHVERSTPDSDTPADVRTDSVAGRVADADASDEATASGADGPHSETPDRTRQPAKRQPLIPAETANEADNVPIRSDTATLRRRFYREIGGLSPTATIGTSDDSDETVYGPNGAILWHPDDAHDRFGIHPTEYADVESWEIDSATFGGEVTGMETAPRSVYTLETGDTCEVVAATYIEAAAGFAGVTTDNCLAHVQINTASVDDAAKTPPVRIPLRVGELYILPLTDQPSDITV